MAKLRMILSNAELRMHNKSSDQDLHEKVSKLRKILSHVEREMRYKCSVLDEHKSKL